MKSIMILLAFVVFGFNSSAQEIAKDSKKSESKNCAPSKNGKPCCAHSTAAQKGTNSSSETKTPATTSRKRNSKATKKEMGVGASKD